MRKTTFGGCAATVLALCAPAQEIDPARLDALEAKVRFRFDEEGRVMMAPDPFTADEDVFVPVLGDEAGVSFAFVGVFGLAGFLLGGPSDLASLADAPRFFARVGAEDALLLQAIGRPTGDAPWPQVLETLLALRAVEARALKAAIPIVERVAEDDAADPFVRRAAVEAAAVLEGRPRPPLAVQLGDLEEVLGRVPESAHFVARIDAYRLPPVRRASAWARQVGRAVVRQRALEMPQFYNELDYLQGLRIAEAAGVLPYELARRYGNHRVDRVVFALRIPEGGMRGVPGIRISAEGRFEVGRVRSALEDAGADVAAGDGGMIEMPLGDGFELTLGPGRLALTSDAFVSSSPGEIPEGVRDALVDDAQIALWVAPDVPLPETVKRLRPTWLRMSVLSDGADMVLRLDGAWPDPTGAAAFRGLLASLPGLAERALAGIDGSDPLLDVLDAMEIELEGERSTVTVPIPDIDVGALLVELVKSGAFD